MRLRAIAGLLGLGLLASACQTAAPEPPTPVAAPTEAPREKTHLVVGYVALNAAQLPAWVAKEEGIFDKNGLDVELQYLPTTNSPTAAILAGQIQIVVAAEQPIQASLNGADLVYIAAPTSTIFFSLFTRPDITSADTLRGKKVGITSTGAATETAAKMALRSLGLDPARDVALSNLGSAANILAGLQNRAVEGGILSSPTSLQARNLGMHELVNVARLGNPFPSSWAAASRKFIAEHEDAIRNYVKSIAEAISFEYHNPEPTQEVLATYSKIEDPAVSRSAYEEVVPYLKKNAQPDVQAVRNALNEMSGTIPQAASADPASFIDSRFTDELDPSGFIKSLYP